MDSSLRVLFVEHLHLDRWRTRRRAQLELDLQSAIDHCQIDLHFQPQYDLHTGCGTGVEALARWSRINGEPIPPAMFIPVAENLGLIGALGTAVLSRACATLSGWRGCGPRPPTLSVNVSALQINETFCEAVTKILHDTGFPADRLELEITESVLIADLERTLRCLRVWKSLGIRIALDDFGTGYCGLSYLGRLPVDRIKLDRSFVQRMMFEKKTAAIVRSMFALGKELEISVMAEGIETEHQCGMLEVLGCMEVQGNLMAKARPAVEAQALLMKPWGLRGERGLHAA